MLVGIRRGGWGGRFGEDGKNTVADFNPHSGRYESSYTLTRWFDDIQNDFAARVDWCTATAHEDANHAPTVSVTEGIDITAKAGETIHMIVEVTDDGAHALKRYQRVVVTVA